MKWSCVSLFGIVGASDPSGVCSPAEKAIWASNPEFSLRISKFAVASLGRSAGVIQKLTEAYPSLGVSCAGCFGEAVACGTKNCFLSCIRSATSPDCVACSNEHCTPRLMECIGTSSASELPPKPVESVPSTTTKAPRTRKLAQETDDFFEIVEIIFGQGSSSESKDSTWGPSTFSDTTALPILGSGNRWVSFGENDDGYEADDETQEDTISI